MELIELVSTGLSQRLPRKNEAGYDEKDMNHGSARVNDSDDRQLYERGRSFLGIDTIVGQIRLYPVGEVVNKDDERCNTYQSQSQPNSWCMDLIMMFGIHIVHLVFSNRLAGRQIRGPALRAKTFHATPIRQDASCMMHEMRHIRNNEDVYIPRRPSR